MRAHRKPHSDSIAPGSHKFGLWNRPTIFRNSYWPKPPRNVALVDDGPLVAKDCPYLK